MSGLAADLGAASGRVGATILWLVAGTEGAANVCSAGGRVGATSSGSMVGRVGALSLRSVAGRAGDVIAGSGAKNFGRSKGERFTSGRYGAKCGAGGLEIYGDRGCTSCTSGFGETNTEGFGKANNRGSGEASTGGFGEANTGAAANGRWKSADC